MTMNDHLAERIVQGVKVRGFDRVDIQNVWEVYETGSISESVVGQDYDDRLTDAIMAELEEYGAL